ncbi:MAG: outer membrane beta-barrel protein [Tannerella sp.]|nr:outer membrane beta-barrel protein [Tannerella sp.]
MNATAPISGRIIADTAGTPLEYANVLLLSLPDSTFASGTVSDEKGRFQLVNVGSGKYVLKISYIGLETGTVLCEVSANPVDIGDIRLKESNVLNEIIITSKQNPFRPGDNGGIVANVAATLLSTVGTANDVLQRMPGVTVDNGKITVFGKGVPIVYINNRRIRDISELERTESSEIYTVELIANPGAKYDAEGRAVLLIKTKSNIDGFSAQVTERLRQGKYSGDYENINISYTHDELNLFATYVHNHSKQEATEDHYYTLKNTDGVWQHRTFLPYRYTNIPQQVSTGFDYSLNDRHAVGGQYQFYTGKYDDTMPIHAITHLNGVLHEMSHSDSYTKDNDYQHLVNIFYNGDFSEQYSFRFDFDYLKNKNDKKQYTEETISSDTESREINVCNQTDYYLYAGKLTNSWKSDIGLIELGGEYNNIAGNGYMYSNGYADDNEFTNMEQKAAGFVSYSHKIKGINIAGGLRYEFTFEQFTEGVTKQVIIDRTYSDIYPNISVSGTVKNVDLSLAFNKRTQRPSFSQLNGNVVYVNRFVFQKGNPYLNKSNIYDVNLQATMKPFYLDIGYAYVKNPVLISFMEQQSNANAILSTYANFPQNETLYATLNWNTQIKFWQPNYTTGVEQPFFTATYDGQGVEYDKISYFFKAYNDFMLPHEFVLSCNFNYQSDRQEAFIESKSYQRIDTGIRKSLFNNTLRLNLMVYDIFDWVKDKNYMRLNNMQWDADKKYETRYATLSVSYLFNNYRKKYRGNSAAQNDIDRF